MSLRIVELVFRHKVLLILPIILGLAGGVAWAISSSNDRYISHAAIWVDPPSFLTNTSVLDFNVFLSPAQNQTDAMTELLGTNSFADNVLGRVDGLGSAVLRQPLTREELRANTAIYPTGNHVVVVQHASDSPILAASVVQAVQDQYSSVFAVQVADYNQRAEVFFEEQLTIARAELDATTVDFQTYLAARPELAQTSIDNLQASALSDPEFVRRQSAVLSARDSFNQIFGQLAETQLSSNTNGSSSNFRVLDEAKVPLFPTAPGLRARALKPALGLIAGVFLSTAAFVLLWRLDRTVRLPSDLSFVQPGTPIMILPALRARRRSWPQGFVRLAAAISSGLTPFGFER